MTLFKTGDKVYLPTLSKNVGEVADDLVRLLLMAEDYPIAVDVDNTRIYTTVDGLFEVNAPVPCIYHATQENYELLSKLYPNVEFEKPHKEPKEIIKMMLDSDWHLVNYRIYSNKKTKNKVITKQRFHTLNCDGYFDRYTDCEVIDPKTGKVIVDFVDGEIITE